MHHATSIDYDNAHKVPKKSNVIISTHEILTILTVVVDGAFSAAATTHVLLLCFGPTWSPLHEGVASGVSGRFFAIGGSGKVNLPTLVELVASVANDVVEGTDSCVSASKESIGDGRAYA
jgi:hypothetical protein